MILSNKEKNEKLSNTKGGRPTHVENMSCVLRSARGMPPPPRNFLFSTWFSRLLSTFAAV